MRILLTAMLILLATNAYGQAPGLPLVQTPSMSGARFFINGDVLWATTKLNGDVQPQQYDKSYSPSFNIGMNMGADNAMLLGYRYLGTQTTAIFDEGVPDLESSTFRKLTLQNIDLTYREKLGGEGAPMGMDVDVGFRFAWARFHDETNASTIAGPVVSERDLSFLTAGTRMGLRPYLTFDQTWHMTLYAQGNVAYLWGTFNTDSWLDQTRLVHDKGNSTLWNWDAEAGFSMSVPGTDGALQVTVGYRYEQWLGERLGFITGTDNGRLTNYGPFARLQFSF